MVSGSGSLLTQVLFVCLLFPWSVQGQMAASVPQTGSPPAWVQWITPDPSVGIRASHESGGQIITLVDTQINAATSETFIRVVKEITTQTGVQSGANLGFTWDPSFQKLIFHQITILRDAKRMDRLDLAKFKIIQQETDLYRQIYNGALSALLFIEDVRPGDRIEYAYTIRGENPSLRGRFSDTFILGGSVPMRQRRVRLLWPKDRVFFFRTHTTSVQPVERAVGNTKEYVWDLHDVPAVVVEDQVPSWLPSCPWGQLSEFVSWSDVAVWATELYGSPDPDSPELKEQVAKLRRPGASAEETVQRALEFVQGSIRYLGIEFGPHSYRPTDPATVLRRRFGDCKDKAFLLSTLLRGLGYDATPVLVATGFRHTLPDLLPAPHDFDHVIVRVVAGGSTYWLDPTRTYQRGPAGQRHLPAYAFGLLVRPGETGLTPIPSSDRRTPETITAETFRVGGQRESSQLNVTSTYKGFDAEWMRAILDSEGREGLAKSLLNDYAQRYPGITPSAPLVIEDSSNSDTLIFKHAYSITNFWVLSDNKQRYTCQFYPLGIHSWITKPATAVRSMPIEISFPRRRSVQTRINLPEYFALSSCTNTITGPAAELRMTRSYHGQTLWMDYEYNARTNLVPASLTVDHLNSLDRMEDALGYSLTWQNMDGIGKGETVQLADFHPRNGLCSPASHRLGAVLPASVSTGHGSNEAAVAGPSLERH